MTGLPSRIRRLAALGACAGVALGVPLLAAPSALADSTELYGCTGALQTSTVPTGDNLAIVTLDGASGGNTDNNGHMAYGGAGEQLVAQVPVSDGQTLAVRVGCQGSVLTGTYDGGGYNGGGGGGVGPDGVDGSFNGAGGGGASSIAPAGGSSSALYAIAAGGGGAGANGGTAPSPLNGNGGNGGKRRA